MPAPKKTKEKTSNLPKVKSKSKPKTRGQTVEIELRTVEIARKFEEGYSSDQIIEWIARTYNLSDDRAYRELTRVYGLFKERTKDELDTLHKRISTMYLSLYRKAMEDENPILALKTLELYSNFATNKDIINIQVINDTQVNLNLESFTDDDLEKLLTGDTVKAVPNG
ncbi:hypothetical protein [Leptospira bandrabouensis]|uniref:Uncharacterized protein n=1 Tax=Leptospira bandrabouensis TaxID=2484903 RepID=A0A6H3NRZ5_9LEPT|nr:hypothetical protein [Leptospira bandrabouensis]TGN09972.1 hypothetical protein EHR07_00400 [Leptospira bandrabouensis]TGN12370.1 hypothetical protein EHR08_13390 [Leptospira bandrabouensis]